MAVTPRPSGTGGLADSDVGGDWLSGLTRLVGDQIVFCLKLFPGLIIYLVSRFLLFWFPTFWWLSGFLNFCWSLRSFPFPGYLVSWSQGFLVSRFPGFLVSWFPEILVSGCRSFLLSWFLISQCRSWIPFCWSSLDCFFVFPRWLVSRYFSLWFDAFFLFDFLILWFLNYCLFGLLVSFSRERLSEGFF